MKRLIKRELYTVAELIVTDLRKERAEKIESEFITLKKTPLYKTMKRRARSLDAYLYAGEKEAFLSTFESAMRYRISVNLNQKYGNVPIVREVVAKLILQQIDATDLASLVNQVKATF